MMPVFIQSAFIVTGLVSVGTASLPASLSTGTGVQSGLNMVGLQLLKRMKSIRELSLQC